MKDKLCICNNCNTIMLDENPDEQPELELPENIEAMIFIHDGHGGYFACPKCLSDNYLMDLYEL